jgi:hypothetical protein
MIWDGSTAELDDGDMVSSTAAIDHVSSQQRDI